MSNLLGAAAGASVDRRKGNSGFKGAIAGAVLQSVAKTVVPILVTAVVGWAIKRLFKTSDREKGTPAP